MLLLRWARRCGFTVWLLAALASAAQAQAVLPVPALTARVMDQTGTLNAAQLSALEAKLAGFEQTQGSQIVILLVPTTQPEDIAAYANRVFNTWKPGRAGLGDGLLLVVAKQDRKIRLEVARALEGAIPDLAAKQVIDETLTPHFRQNDFAGGLDLALDQLVALIRGEGLPPPTSPPRAADAGMEWMDLGILLLVAVPVVGSLLRRILGHKLGTLATGGAVAALTFVFTASLLLAGMAALLAVLLTFIAGTPLGSALLAASQQRQHHGGRWGGGDFGGGFGGGFGSGGGFSSGGGGDGAGGGASGDW
ncbi:MAG: TPM domain-containing protein [Hylemonella sp.]|nr:TPM domain-containing protein [Hylemonella sp.]MDP1935671.1 TPM domain-containing protein [Hylemonella sp.]